MQNQLYLSWCRSDASSRGLENIIKMNKRKNIRDPLAITAHEFRRIPDTSRNCYLEGSLALRHPTSSQIKSKRLKGFYLHTPLNESIEMGHTNIPDDADNSPGFYAARRDAIHYFYLLFGSPSEAELADGEVVSEICRRLLISTRSKRHVINILNEIIHSKERKFHSKRKLHIPLSNTINDHGEEAKIIMDFMEKGLGITQTTFLVNLTREKNGKQPVARNTIESYVNRSKLIERTVRPTQVSQ